MKKYFPAGNVIFQIFFYIKLFFYKYSVLLDQLYIMLIKYAQILTLGPFKNYVRSEGGGRGYSKSVLKRTKGGGLPRVYVRSYYF